MIEFFKRIRQRLLTENLPTAQAGEFSKYLKKAIGDFSGYYLNYDNLADQYQFEKK